MIKIFILSVILRNFLLILSIHNVHLYKKIARSEKQFSFSFSVDICSLSSDICRSLWGSFCLGLYTYYSITLVISYLGTLQRKTDILSLDFKSADALLFSTLQLDELFSPAKWMKEINWLFQCMWDDVKIDGSSKLKNLDLSESLVVKHQYIS